MLFKREILDGIADGTVTLAFRRWRRPTVKAGGTLNTRVGQLAICAVDIIEEDMITQADAHCSGYASRDTLLQALSSYKEGQLYRIAFRLAGQDPRIALRAAYDMDTDTIAALKARLARLDKASRSGPWTHETLSLIAQFPARRAADLANEVGREKPDFKRDVRKLKAMGLTESLEVGYRLSPRGTTYLKAVSSDL